LKPQRKKESSNTRVSICFDTQKTLHAVKQARERRIDGLKINDPLGWMNFAGGMQVLEVKDLIIVLDRFAPETWNTCPNRHLTTSTEVERIYISGRSRRPSGKVKRVWSSVPQERFVTRLHFASEYQLCSSRIWHRSKLRVQLVRIWWVSGDPETVTHHNHDVVLMTDRTGRGAERNARVVRVGCAHCVHPNVCLTTMLDPVPRKRPTGASPDVVRAQGFQPISGITIYGRGLVETGRHDGVCTCGSQGSIDDWNKVAVGKRVCECGEDGRAGLVEHGRDQDCLGDLGEGSSGVQRGRDE
jgi:hypothetical protein